MTIKVDESTALLIIDAQKGFDVPGHWGKERNNPDAEEKIKRVLDRWRSKNGLCIYSVHDSIHPDSPLRLSTPTGAIMDGLEPTDGDVIIRKSVNSAFIGTDLELQLRRKGIDRLVIAGFLTDHCVAVTTRMAGNLGYDTFLLSDATATFDRKGPTGRSFDADLVHSVSLATIHGEFATVLTTDELLSQI